MEMGKRIKEIRESLNMTQSELADKLGLSVHTVSKYEQGQRNPKIEMLQKIATALNVPVQELLELDEDKESFDEEINLLSKMLEDNTMLKQNLDVLTRKDVKSLTDFQNIINGFVTGIVSSITNTPCGNSDYEKLLHCIEHINRILDTLDVFISFYRLDESSSSIKEIDEFIHFKHEKLKQVITSQKEGE